MNTFIYETNVPGLLNQLQVETRVNLWKGLSHVFIPAYRGMGVTWNSTILPIDQGINILQSIETLRYIRSHGIKVVLVFDIIRHNSALSLHPEWLLTPDYYDIWNKSFINWRVSLIKECLETFPCDAVGFDFIRSLNEQHQTNLSPPHEAVMNALAAFSSAAYPYPTISINHMGHAYTKRQGIDVLRWFNERLIHEACLFNYDTTWFEFDSLPYEQCYFLDSNYTDTQTGPQPKHETSVIKKAKPLIQRKRISGYGFFTANMLTQEHVDSLVLL